MTSRATALVLLLFGTSASAQVADHLQCLKSKDPVALKGVVDLESPQLGIPAGCKVSKAALFCVRAAKTVVSAATGAQPLVPLPHEGADAGSSRVCDKAKCPTATLPDQLVTDQCGTRTLAKLKAAMLCRPAAEGAAACAWTKGGNHWTATTVANNPLSAWTVAFSLGETISGGKTTPLFVRAVRTVSVPRNGSLPARARRASRSDPELDYLPLHLGSRFSAKAVAPSIASLLPKTLPA